MRPSAEGCITSKKGCSRSRLLLLLARLGGEGGDLEVCLFVYFSYDAFYV